MFPVLICETGGKSFVVAIQYDASDNYCRCLAKTEGYTYKHID